MFGWWNNPLFGGQMVHEQAVPHVSGGNPDNKADSDLASGRPFEWAIPCLAGGQRTNE